MPCEGQVSLCKKRHSKRLRTCDGDAGVADVFPQPGANLRNCWLSNIPKSTGGFRKSPKTLLLSAHPPTLLGTCLGKGQRVGVGTRMEQTQGWRRDKDGGAPSLPVQPPNTSHWEQDSVLVFAKKTSPRV